MKGPYSFTKTEIVRTWIERLIACALISTMRWKVRVGKMEAGNGKWWSEGVDHVHPVQLEGGGFRVNIGVPVTAPAPVLGVVHWAVLLRRVHAHGTRTYLNRDGGG